MTDLALYLEKEKILVIADTHIGFEEALNKQGILVPRHQINELTSRLEKIFLNLKKDKKKIKKIIINGDIKNEFGTISRQEWNDTLALLDFLIKHCKKIILIKGNHDTILSPIAKKRDISIVDSFSIRDILIIHGNKIPKKIEKNIKKIIIAHEHPAIGLKKGPRTELYKCFLKGKYKNKTLIVMPSFNFVSEGANILKEEILSPFLKQNLKNFECYAVEDKVYYFGRIKDLS